MRTPYHKALRAPPERRGVALLLALLLLFILIAITSQIVVTTSTDARIARNDLTTSVMDLAIESALLNVAETLKTDGEATDSAGGAPPPAAGAGGGAAPGAGQGGAAGAAGGQSQPSDSRRDEWHEPQRTTINDIQLRITVVDEDSKYNVLNMLAADEKEAQAAFDRVVRILDLCREGSRDFDIDPRTAEQMAKAMLEHMQRRKNSRVPRPSLLSDEEGLDRGFPLSLEEFAALEPFSDHHFKDFRDRDGAIVHSIGSFLTVWTSLGLAADLPQAGLAGGGSGARPGAAGGGGAAGSQRSGSGSQGGGAGAGGSGSSGRSGASAGGSGTGQGGGSGGGGQGGTGQGGAGQGAAGQAGTGQGGAGAGGSAGGAATTTGGYAVNVNTAPAAVLKGLFDDREVHPRFFDKVIEYRNLEDEEAKDAANEDSQTPREPELDEYGQEKIQRRIFDSISELTEVEGFRDLPAEAQTRLNQILTTQSHVFSIYVVARKTTSARGDEDAMLSPQQLRKKEESAGDSLMRVVRGVVWRRTVDEEVVLTPIVRWQVLDYLPYEVLDFPPEDR